MGWDEIRALIIFFCEGRTWFSKGLKGLQKDIVGLLYGIQGLHSTRLLYSIPQNPIPKP